MNYNSSSNHFSSFSLDTDPNNYSLINLKDIETLFETLKPYQHYSQMTSLYIQYEIHPFPFELHPQIYFKCFPKIHSQLLHFFQFEYSHIFSNHFNTFFLIIFDTPHDEILDTYLSFYTYLQKKSFNYQQQCCHFQLKCGTYISHPFLKPQQIYYGAFEQFANNFKKPESIYSMKSFDDIFLHDHK